MTADEAGTLAVALALDEPEQLIRHLKIRAMQRMDAVAPIDAHLAKKWAEVSEGMAAIELKLEEIKRAPV